MTTTRDRIVETARRLFSEKGYLATGVAEIRAAAGVHSGSLYHAFPSKQDLLVAVLENYRDQMDARLVGPAWTGVEDPVARIFALLDVYRRFLVESRFLFGCPIGFVALELHDPDEPVRRLVWQNFENWRTRVGECLAAADLPGATDKAALATFVLTTMEGAVMLARTARSMEPFDQAVAMLRDYVGRLATKP